MMTAMLCVEISGRHELYDLWQLTENAEYHEAGPAAAEEQRRRTAGLSHTGCRDSRARARR